MSRKDIFEDYEEVVAEIQALRAENAALSAEVKKFTSHNTERDEVAFLENVSFGASTITNPEMVGQYLYNCINDRVAQLRAGA
jgi:cell division septum initiation protein DivIVA